MLLAALPALLHVGLELALLLGTTDATTFRLARDLEIAPDVLDALHPELSETLAAGAGLVRSRPTFLGMSE